MSKTTLSDVEILDAIVDAQIIVEKKIAQQPAVQADERLRQDASELADVLAQFYQTAAQRLNSEDRPDA